MIRSYCARLQNYNTKVNVSFIFDGYTTLSIADAYQAFSQPSIRCFMNVHKVSFIIYTSILTNS